MLIKALRFILSILLIPACVAITICFYDGITSITAISESGLSFIFGVLAYCILHLLIFKPDFLYVLGHELTHAVAAIFSGGKATKINVSGKGGSVRSTGPNVFVMLAPYLIPGYAVLLAILYFLLSFFIDVGRFSDLFIFLIGFTLMLHLTYTSQSMREKQSDLIKSGYLFSISFIYIANLVIVFGIISLLFKEADFLDFISGAYVRSEQFYYSFWRQLFL
ncbi:MAG: hypothetical protein KJ706_05310 [Candidatus Omnitrophica bacterium]|nr:hypothetical protein [Candidatus Omnitrophota bacterium]